MTSLAVASSVVLRRVAFLGGTPLGNSLGSIPSVLALTNSVIRRGYHEKVRIFAGQSRMKHCCFLPKDMGTKSEVASQNPHKWVDKSIRNRV